MLDGEESKESPLCLILVVDGDYYHWWWWGWGWVNGLFFLPSDFGDLITIEFKTVNAEPSRHSNFSLKLLFILSPIVNHIWDPQIVRVCMSLSVSQRVASIPFPFPVFKTLTQSIPHSFRSKLDTKSLDGRKEDSTWQNEMKFFLSDFRSGFFSFSLPLKIEAYSNPFFFKGRKESEGFWVGESFWSKGWGRETQWLYLKIG